ncbi:SHOCT domain-containing protein [Leifsonia sp. YAF41]|uniref:SHOCT domain-containing protein n=1 Tax=Leifsonia sp. YAF41 TaxID=3233086 RepID=UPI003F9AD785
MPLIRRFGRPGLLGLAAGTAVIAGTATAVRGGMERHQQQQAAQQYDAAQYQAQQQAQYAATAPPAAPPVDPMIAQLQQLAALHAQGVLSDAEFTAAKAKLLS